MPTRLMIINGPNLNLLGIREPHIYGSTRLEAIEHSCREFAGLLDVDLEFHQSNHEGVIVDLIQAARERADAIIINPAGLSFTSIPIIDAIKIFEGPVIEWRGPAPYYFLAVPEDDSDDIKFAAKRIEYWGQVPVVVRIDDTEFFTALFPKDGRYLIPLKDKVRRAEGIEVDQVVTVSLRVGRE